MSFNRFWSCCKCDRRRVAPATVEFPTKGMATTESDQKQPSTSSNARSDSRQGGSSVPSFRMDLMGQKLSTDLNDYQIFQSIGVGFFGTARIMLARHRPSRVFAVARLYDLEVLTLKQFEEVQAEMCISQQLSHPNILSYYCCFVSEMTLWALQPLMHYGSCADILHSTKKFGSGFRENVIAIILRDVVKALNYLHSLGYVHRSVRAKHFLIHESGHVKLSGLRSMVSLIESGAKKKALHGHFSGTGENICWMAPEVLAQDLAGYSIKSDVYSIGIAALELATGEAPFAGLPLTEIMMLKLRGHPPMLLRKSDEDDPIQNFSKTFFKVVDMCVHPDPAHRPPTSKLLSLSFLKFKKKSTSYPSLKELLLPLVPLDTSKIRPDPDGSTGLEEDMQAVSICEESWILT